MSIEIKKLIKFGNEKNLKNLLKKGEVYMRSIKSFREDDKSGIGDRYEGMSIISNNSSPYIKEQNPLKNRPNKMHITQVSVHREGHVGNIFSTYAISGLSLKTPVHQIDQRMKDNGSHCLVITNVKDFTERIFNSLKEKGFKYEEGLVKYNNFEKNYHTPNYFKKSDIWSYQMEHRIFVKTPQESPLIINIGSIEKYTEMYKSVDLIKGFQI